MVIFKRLNFQFNFSILNTHTSCRPVPKEYQQVFFAYISPSLQGKHYQLGFFFNFIVNIKFIALLQLNGALSSKYLYEQIRHLHEGTIVSQCVVEYNQKLGRSALSPHCAYKSQLYHCMILPTSQSFLISVSIL